MKRGAGLAFGGLAVIITFAALGPVAALAAAWFVLSPDAVASTARGGGAGAIGAAATAAGDYLAEEWRAGGPARARRRTARRDRWWAAGGIRRQALAFEHALVIAWRAIRSSAVAAIRAGAVIPAGAKAGAQIAREHRARRTADTDPDEPDPTETTSGDTTSGDTDAPDTSPGAGDAGADGVVADPGPGRVPGSGTSDSGGRPATGQAPPQGDGMTQTDTTAEAQAGGELLTTDDLRAEVIEMQTLIEEAQQLGNALKEWQSVLLDTYESGNAAGGPKTGELTEAVQAVAEAGAEPGAFADALNAIRRGCDRADALGEEASSMGADGHTRAYVNS